MGSKRAFTDEHLSRLLTGAKRRKEEQLVGNWIRLTNRVLYEKLLVEIQTPRSMVLDTSTPQKIAEPVKIEEVRRPLPPRMDIT